VFIDQSKGAASNPWKAQFFTRIWHMAEDAEWFRTSSQLEADGLTRDGTDWVKALGPDPPVERWVPLYEAKMTWFFDHRWSTYDGSETRPLSDVEKTTSYFEPTARYWVPLAEVEYRLAEKGWMRGWLLGWRKNDDAKICRCAICESFFYCIRLCGKAKNRRNQFYVSILISTCCS